MSLKIEKISNKHTRYIFNLRNERNVREFYNNNLSWLRSA